MTDIWVHPDYRSERAAWKDLAIVTTKEVILKVARADLAREKPAAKAKVSIAGWGCTGRTPPKSPLTVPGDDGSRPSAKYGHIELLDEAGTMAIFSRGLVLGVAANQLFSSNSSNLALQTFASVPDAIEAIDNVIKTAKPSTKSSSK